MRREPPPERQEIPTIAESGARNLQGSIFEPNEPDHGEIEDAERDQPNAMLEGETVKLVENERAERNDREGICP